MGSGDESRPAREGDVARLSGETRRTAEGGQEEYEAEKLSLVFFF
jgi:hypothetical protein